MVSPLLANTGSLLLSAIDPRNTWKYAKCAKDLGLTATLGIPSAIALPSILYGAAENTLSAIYELDWSAWDPLTSGFSAAGKVFAYLGTKAFSGFWQGVSGSSEVSSQLSTSLPDAPVSNMEVIVGLRPDCFTSTDSRCLEISYGSQGTSLTSHVLPAFVLVGTLWLATYAYQLYTAEKAADEQDEEPTETKEVKS